jgi:hypothetical protein
MSIPDITMLIDIEATPVFAHIDHDVVRPVQMLSLRLICYVVVYTVVIVAFEIFVMHEVVSIIRGMTSRGDPNMQMMMLGVIPLPQAIVG